MTDAEKSVDALLATTCSRLLSAAEQVTLMRRLHQQHDMQRYCQMATAAAEHLSVSSHAITEAHRILLAQQGIAIQQGGGLVN